MNKILGCLLVVGVAVSAFAVGEDATLVTLGTKGPDTYADGKVALDGEYYALVWTRTGSVFAGFNVDGSVVAPTTDAVLYAGPKAKNGCCPKTTFAIDKAVLNALKGSGSFALYLLDTRAFGANGAGGVTVGNAVQGARVVATAAQLSMTGAIGGASDAGVFEPSVLADAPTPKIVGIRIEGDEVVLTVENTAKVLNYNVAAGEKPDELANGAAKDPVTGNGGTIELRVPKTGNSQFFRVKRN